MPKIAGIGHAYGARPNAPGDARIAPRAAVPVGSRPQNPHNIRRVRGRKYTPGTYNNMHVLERITVRILLMIL